MKIGIVIPSFNSEDTIQETIDSIIDQNYPHLDLVIVDGLSTDSTMDIVRSYGDKLRWISEPDSGQTEAINKGIKTLDAEIIKWVNSDDLLLPGSLELVNDFFSNNEKIDFVYGDIEFIDSNGKVIGAHLEPKFSSFVMLYGHNLFADPSSFWRKRAYDNIGKLDESILYSMDYEMWVRFYKNGVKFSSIAIAIAQYRIDRTNASIKNFDAMRKEHFEILISKTRWLNFLPKGIRYSLLSCLLIFARLVKKIKVLIQRRNLNFFIFRQNVKKLR